jgi:hypothetical protein
VFQTYVFQTRVFQAQRCSCLRRSHQTAPAVSS